MTLLHQAAQKAVEALKYMQSEKVDYMIRNKLGDPSKETATKLANDAIAALESALQQQPEPVAVWQSQCKDGTWADCTEANARAGERYGFAMRALYTAPPALQHQEVPAAVRDAHGNIVLHNGKEVCYRDEAPPTALHQEEPREPVAVARPLTSEEEENAWNTITEQGCSCCTAAVRLFCRLNGITLSDAVLATSPSTTRQQEVGSRPYRTSAGDTLRGIAHRELGDAERWPEIKRLNLHAFDPESEGWSRPRAGTLLALPAAPSTPESGVSGADAGQQP